MTVTSQLSNGSRISEVACLFLLSRVPVLMGLLQREYLQLCKLVVEYFLVPEKLYWYDLNKHPLLDSGLLQSFAEKNIRQVKSCGFCLSLDLQLQIKICCASGESQVNNVNVV
jgi:hypothetical protein